MFKFAARFWEAVRALGAMSSIMTFVLIVGLLIIVINVLNNEEADLSPSPLEYLDAHKNKMGEFYYVPDKRTYCWGDTVHWTSNAYNTAGGVATVLYYIQGVHPYEFVGPEAAQLEKDYPGVKREILSLYERRGDTWHLREGTYIGGPREFVLPKEDELLSGIEPGSLVRLYIDIDVAFSRNAGYYLEWRVAKGCKS